jgi:hypothetical protein
MLPQTVMFAGNADPPSDPIIRKFISEIGPKTLINKNDNYY